MEEAFGYSALHDSLQHCTVLGWQGLDYGCRQDDTSVLVIEQTRIDD